MSRLVLVGESNPYGSSPAMALYHLPRHASGNRLREHVGLRDATYAAIARVNLCTGKWSAPAARERVEVLLRGHHVVVALGAKVVEAFCSVTEWERPEFFSAVRVGDRTLVSLPHPSGLSRPWNAPGARERARTVLRGCAPDVPWGEAG